MQTMTISGRLPAYNELHRQPWQVARATKQAGMDIVMWQAKIAKLEPIEGKCVVTIACFEPNARRDVDNVTSGAAKIILDALQQIGILKGDGRKYVDQVIFPKVEVDRENPRIEVTLEDA